MRLIDADELIRRNFERVPILDERTSDGVRWESIVYTDDIENAPTIGPENLICVEDFVKNLRKLVNGLAKNTNKSYEDGIYDAIECAIKMAANQQEESE